jgi:hypothetical protein
MELSQDLIIEVALNAVGYIAAAGLVLTLLSLLRRTRSETEASPGSIATAAPDGPVAATDRKPAGASQLEFVKFSDNSSAGAEARKAENAEKPDGSRRDRSEIIRVAREMLKAGATHEKITSILPISQAELALLSAGKR